ncbi:MAG TPA: ABC transporter ATP-binding protein [Phycisphaerae bacterium]|nr:ABC transporter ATP-binding protein [Phycisphaerae bacterium]
MISDTDRQLVIVRDLKTYFPVRGGLWHKRYVRAVDGVSFDIPRGRTLALVGESGSGKTTVGRSILRLVPVTAGQAFFDGADVLALPERQVRPLRRHMSMIFQDPAESLNPRMTVEHIVAEPLKVHGLCGGRAQRRQRVAELLERVGLSADYAKRYRHEFSGGQRQRIGIARALATEPKFIVCDEPISALDVSIQAQILNLLNDLQDELALTYLFIAHNLAVVEHFADIVAVMYLGRIVETADRDELYANPLHPYTHALFSAVPEPEPGRVKTQVRLEGEPPSPINPPTGCPFHPRCPLARQAARDLPGDQRCPVNLQGETVILPRVCVHEEPKLELVPGRPGHEHACHLRRQGFGQGVTPKAQP